jgi:FemAB-related protein (PEP-CTERM system-associated)
MASSIREHTVVDTAATPAWAQRLGDARALPSRAEPQIATAVSEADWNDYVHRHTDGTMDHLWSWRQIFERVFGHETVYLTARRGETIVGVLPLVQFKSRLFGRFLVSLPFLNYGGVLADDETAAAALVERAVDIGRRFGARHVELRHLRRQFPALACREHKVGMRLLLPSAHPGLWDGLDRKVRNQIRKAQKAGLTVTSGSGELLTVFYDIFARNMRDLGTPVYSRRLFEEALARFGNRARVFVVGRGGVPMASAIAIRFKGTMGVPWASSLREYRALCPNMLLYWAMLEHAHQDSATEFDFGRSSPGGGTHRFKLQWGAAEIPLYWEYVLFKGSGTPDHGPARFEAAARLWAHLPLAVANALGPRIVRSIP